MTNEPALGTTLNTLAFTSSVRTIGMIMLEVVTMLLVTVNVVAPMAKLTVPAGVFIVRSPVVPAGVTVEDTVCEVLTTILSTTNRL